MLFYTLLRHIFSVKYVYYIYFFYVQCRMFSKFSSLLTIIICFQSFQASFRLAITLIFCSMNLMLQFFAVWKHEPSWEKTYVQMGLKLPFHHFVLGDRLIKPIQVVGVYKFWVVGFKYVFNLIPIWGRFPIWSDGLKPTNQYSYTH